MYHFTLRPFNSVFIFFLGQNFKIDRNFAAIFQVFPDSLQLKKKEERIKDNAFIIIKLNILHVFFFFKNTINFPQYLFIKLVTPDGKT